LADLRIIDSSGAIDDRQLVAEASLGYVGRGAVSGAVAPLAAAYRRPPGGVVRSGPAVMMTRPPRLSRGAA